MPQSERSDTIKQLLRWLASQKNGATVQAMVQYVKWEITEGGATDNSARKYIEDLDRAKLIEYIHPFWKVTRAGMDWLARYSI
jgi:hypothetical protein